MGTGNHTTAYIWENGVSTAIGTVELHSLNNRGEVVCTFGNTRAIWSKANGLQGIVGADTLALNDLGQMARKNGTGVWIWSDGGWRLVDGGGELHGLDNDGRLYYAWDTGVARRALGGEREFLGSFWYVDHNNAGQALGYVVPNGQQRGVLWSAGSLTDLGLLPGWSSFEPRGLNDSAEVIGEAHLTAYGDASFYWKGGVFTRTLDLVPGNTTWDILRPVAINNRGQILGGGRRAADGANRPILMTPYATFTGTVKLRGWMGNIASLPVRVIVDDEPEAVIHLAVTGDRGTFSVDIPPVGNHTISVKPNGFLSDRITVTPSGAYPTGSFLGPYGDGLLPGDTNNDDAVDDVDLTLVILDYGFAGGVRTGNPYTDCDGSGVVDDGDLTLVILSYGE